MSEEPKIILDTCTSQELIDSMDGFELTDDGLWTGCIFRDYIAVSIQGSVFGPNGNHYFIATSDDSPNPRTLKHDTSNFEVFRAELVRLINLPEEALIEWAEHDEDEE